MISLCDFFRFCHNILYRFYANGEIVKVIDDDYNRIITFKAKNEIIKMNRNCSNIDKWIWTEKYVHEHHAYDKNVIVSWENVWTNSYVQMYKVL